MRRLALSLLSLLLAAATLAAPARAEFGLNGLSAAFTDSLAAPEARAGAHPAANTTVFSLNTRFDPDTAIELVDGALKDLHVALPAGFVGNTTVPPTCELADFILSNPTVGATPDCPAEAAVGYLRVRVSGGLGIVGKENEPLFNLTPAPGQATTFGFWAGGLPQILAIRVNPEPPHNLIATLENASQVAEIRGADTTIWGNPADPAHDKSRGGCAFSDPTRATTPSTTMPAPRPSPKRPT
jgi:hypothetical protein